MSGAVLAVQECGRGRPASRTMPQSALLYGRRQSPAAPAPSAAGGVEREETGSKGSSGPGMGRITLWKCLAVFSDYRGTRPPRLHPLSA